MSERPVPVAVVGAGNMGANHIRVYDELPEAELVEVVEPDPERAAEIRRIYGEVSVVDTVGDLTQAEAATVAVPNESHKAVAMQCLDSGLDILVEKPLAMTENDAATIIEAAEKSDSILQVGHIERFNPAVEALSSILNDRDIIALETHRLGPFNEHLSGVSVIFDLMIHDLDVICSLVDSGVESVSSFGVTKHSQTLDHSVAQLQFDNGVLGTLTASHVTHGKVRTLSAVTKDSYITLDYQTQNIEVQQTGLSETTQLLNKSGYRTETVTESPFVQTREPLKNEIGHFLDCVRKRTKPRVGAEDAMNAIRLATTVVDQTGVKK